MTAVVFFVGGVLVTYLLSQPGLQLVQRYRRKVGWKKFQRTTDDLIDEILASNWRPDVIVGLNSGIVPAGIVALNLRVSELYFYDVLPRYVGTDRNEPEIADKGISLRDKDVLLLDDQTYTGRSLDRLEDHLVKQAEADPQRLRRHALFVHSSGAGPVRLDFTSRSTVRGKVKGMPWVHAPEIRPFWEERKD